MKNPLSKILVQKLKALIFLLIEEVKRKNKVDYHVVIKSRFPINRKDSIQNQFFASLIIDMRQDLISFLLRIINAKEESDSYEDLSTLIKKMTDKSKLNIVI